MVPACDIQPFGSASLGLELHLRLDSVQVLCYVASLKKFSLEKKNIVLDATEGDLGPPSFQSTDGTAPSTGLMAIQTPPLANIHKMD